MDTKRDGHDWAATIANAVTVVGVMGALVFNGWQVRATRQQNADSERQMEAVARQLELSSQHLAEFAEQGFQLKTPMLAYDIGSYRIPLQDAGVKYGFNAGSDVVRIGNYGNSPLLHATVSYTVTAIDGTELDGPVPESGRQPFTGFSNMCPNATKLIHFVPSQLMTKEGAQSASGWFRSYYHDVLGREWAGFRYEFTATRVIDDRNNFVDLEITGPTADCVLLSP